MDGIAEAIESILAWPYLPWGLGLVVLIALGRAAGRVSDEEREKRVRLAAAAETINRVAEERGEGRAVADDRPAGGTTRLGPPPPERPGLPAFELFRCCRAQAVRPLLSGTWRGTALEVLEHSHVYSDESTSSDRVTETLACFIFDKAILPPFVVEQNLHGGRLYRFLMKRRGELAIDVGPHAAFSQEHQVRKHHEHEVGEVEIRELFSNPVLDYLAHRPGLRVESLRRHLLLYRPGQAVGPDGMEAFLSDAHGLVLALRGSR